MFHAAVIEFPRHVHEVLYYISGYVLRAVLKGSLKMSGDPTGAMYATFVAAHSISESEARECALPVDDLIRRFALRNLEDYGNRLL